jgi:hypothetical protein
MDLTMRMTAIEEWKLQYKRTTNGLSVRKRSDITLVIKLL